MVITQIGSRFVVESAQGRLNILNEKSLVYNMKRLFNWKKSDITKLIEVLGQYGKVTIDSNGQAKVA